MNRLSLYKEAYANFKYDQWTDDEFADFMFLVLSLGSIQVGNRRVQASSTFNKLFKYFVQQKYPDVFRVESVLRLFGVTAGDLIIMWSEGVPLPIRNDNYFSFASSTRATSPERLFQISLSLGMSAPFFIVVRYDKPVGISFLTLGQQLKRDSRVLTGIFEGERKYGIMESLKKYASSEHSVQGWYLSFVAKIKNKVSFFDGGMTRLEREILIINDKTQYTKEDIYQPIPLIMGNEEFSPDDFKDYTVWEENYQYVQDPPHVRGEDMDDYVRTLEQGLPSDML